MATSSANNSLSSPFDILLLIWFHACLEHVATWLTVPSLNQNCHSEKDYVAGALLISLWIKDAARSAPESLPTRQEQTSFIMTFIGTKSKLWTFRAFYNFLWKSIPIVFKYPRPRLACVCVAFDPLCTIFLFCQYHQEESHLQRFIILVCLVQNSK